MDVSLYFIQCRNLIECNVMLTSAAFTTFSSVSLMVDQPPGIPRAGAKKMLRIAVRSFIVD